MDSLLHIASRIEAAVNSYVSVRPVTNTEEWKCKFDKEKVSGIFSLGYTLIPIGTRSTQCINFGI
jgi:hypothetical protein